MEGIRVIELASMIAAPACSRILAYLGAEVIKVESLAGEPYRSLTTFTNGYQAIFTELNTQKKSVVFDIRDPEVLKYTRKLIGTADVFLTNVREPSLKRFGLDYDDFKEDCPHLIYAHFSGYGRKGPFAGMPGYDATAFAARSGLYREFVDPSHEPVIHIPGLGDMSSGMALALNVMAALFQRSKTGKGDRVECSLNQVSAWVLMMPMIYAQFAQWFCRNEGDPMDISGTSVKCKNDKWILYASGTIKQFHAILKSIGLNHLIEDPRCSTLTEVIRNTPTLKDEIFNQFMQKTSDEWLSILRANDVPCEVHNLTKDMATDEQLIVNNFITPYLLDDKCIMFPNPPFHMESQNLISSAPGPDLGEHTASILTSLGCSEQEMLVMKERKVIIIA